MTSILNNNMHTIDNSYDSGYSLFIGEVFVCKQFLVSFSDKSLPTVATHVDLRLVQVDVDLGMAQSSSPSITPCVVALDDDNWLFCYQVYCKLFIHLQDGMSQHYYTIPNCTLVTAILAHMQSLGKLVPYYGSNYKNKIITWLV